MTLSTLRRRLPACLTTAVLAIATAARSQAATQADLKWDLSYRAALAAHPIPADEFMHEWLRRYPARPIHEKLAAYAGEPIEASVLIETTDGHTGDPAATWFIKTRNTASMCSIHRKIMSRPCEPLDPVRADTFIRKVMGFKSAPPAVGAKASGLPYLINYLGFLSVYVDGVAMQRPLSALELGGGTGNGASEAPENRLQSAIWALTLSDSDVRQREAALQKQALSQRIAGAAREGNVAMLATLVAPPNQPQPADLTAALALAAENKRQAAVDFLLARGAQIDANESAALKAAVRSASVEMVQYLLDKGAKPDPAPPANGVGTVHQSALGLAVQLKNESMVRLLLARGADLNFLQARSALSTAAMAGELALVDLLLKAGALVDQTTGNDPRTALQFVVGNSGRLGGWPEEKDAQQAILRREAGLAVMVRRLVAGGADVNHIGPGCKSAWQIASEQNSAGMQSLLVELGADPDAHTRCNKILRNGRQAGIDGPEAVARNAVASETNGYLKAHDYAALEKLYQKLKGPQQRTPSGIWKLAIYYNQLKGYSRSSGDQAYWATVQGEAAAWRKQFPQSVAAQLFGVYIHLNRLLAARGTGTYASLSAAQRAEVSSGSAAALSALGAMQQLSAKAKDPEWYRAMLSVLPYANSYSAAGMRRLLDEGRALYPAYHEMYFMATIYAHPRWNAAPDAADQIARRAAEMAGSEQRSLYARIYWYLDQTEYKGKIFETSLADWPTMRTSFDDLLTQYPDAWNLNAYAYFACLATDYATMGDLLKRIGDQPVFAVWGQDGAATYAGCIKHTQADPAFSGKQESAQAQRLSRGFYEFIRFGSRMRVEKNYTAALDALHKAEDIDRQLRRGTSMMAQYHLGRTFFDMGKYDEAVSAFSAGLTTQPDYAEAYWRRGLAQEALGRKELAQQDFASGARHLRKTLPAMTPKPAGEAALIIREMQATFRQHGHETPDF